MTGTSTRSRYCWSRNDADEDAVISFLKEREAEIMCFPAAGTAHLKRVARKLLNLRHNGS